MSDELDKLYTLIEDIEIAMLTTRRADGHLQTRPMATQKRTGGADLWFAAREGSSKLADIQHDQHVNLAYRREKDNAWVSVSGIAVTTRDRGKIRQLWAPDWKLWFAEEGDPRHGTADDPRIVLIGVTVHAATFLEINKPRPVILFELVKGWLTGQEPKLGETHEIPSSR
jgi:general stress protein 26